MNGPRTVFGDPFLPGRNGAGRARAKDRNALPARTCDHHAGHKRLFSLLIHTPLGMLPRESSRLFEQSGKLPANQACQFRRYWWSCRRAKGPIAPKFQVASDKCVGLAQAYRDVCTQLDCYYFDAATVTTSSRVDGVHLDADQTRDPRTSARWNRSDNHRKKGKSPEN